MRGVRAMTAERVVAAWDAVDRCRAVGCDAAGWRRELAEGARAVSGARVVIVGEMERFGRPGYRPLGVTRVGWTDDAAAARWSEYANANADVERKPEFAVLTRAAKEAVTLTRDEVWGQGAWYRSRTYREVHGACGLDDYILSLHPVAGTDLTVSVWAHRGVGEAGFVEADRAGVELVHARVAQLVGRALASAREASVSGVTQRRRQVLAALLDGLAEKQIAGRLGIGRATVHEHVLGVYRHFGVDGRAELLAKWVGRERPE